MTWIVNGSDPGQNEITRFGDYWLGWRLLGDHKPGMAPRIIALDDSYDTFDRLAASRSLRLAPSHSFEFGLGGEP